MIFQSLRLRDSGIPGTGHVLDPLTELTVASRGFSQGPPGNGWDGREHVHHRGLAQPAHPNASPGRALLDEVQVISFMPVFTHRFAETKTSVLQIRGLTALRKRTSHTHMACEDFFQILVGALCGCDLLPSPDEGNLCILSSYVSDSFSLVRSHETTSLPQIGRQLRSKGKAKKERQNPCYTPQTGGVTHA